MPRAHLDSVTPLAPFGSHRVSLPLRLQAPELPRNGSGLRTVFAAGGAGGGGCTFMILLSSLNMSHIYNNELPCREGLSESIVTFL